MSRRAGPVAPRFLHTQALAEPPSSLHVPPVIEERREEPRVSDTDSVAPLVVWPDSDRERGCRKRCCVVVGFSDECLRYVSGCTRMTLLKGSASINGYSLPLRVRNEKPWHFPAWFPAAQLHICCDDAPASSSSSSKRKRAEMSLGSLLGPDETARFAGSASIALHESLVTILLLEGVDVEEQEWLVAAEDQRPFSLFPIPRVGVDTTHPKCCKLDSALVASAMGMQTLGIETTNIPPDWVAAADTVIGRVATAPCTVICGAKGVGKSTSLRYTLNRLLRHTEKVCVLDCDLGQPEYTVPGVVSLHVINSPTLCPAYANLQEPVLSFYLGDVTTKNEPDKLMRAVALLMARYQVLVSDAALEHEAAQQKLLSEVATSKAPPGNSFEVFNDAPPKKKKQQQHQHQQHHHQKQQQHLLPLIVNSDGFVRFMGAEILSGIFDIVRPTNILHLCTDKDRHLPAVEKIRGEESICVSTLQPGRLSACRIASTELRTLRFVSYFLRDSALLAKAAKSNLGVYIRNGALADKQGAIATALLGATTYSVPFQEVYLHFLGGAEIPTRLHLALLNASFVAITAPEEPPRHAVASLSSSSSSTPSAEATFSIKHVVHSDAQQELLSPCLGLGLVRAVDVTHERLLVITPTNPSALSGDAPAICLVRGHIPLPTILLHAPTLPCFPYLSGESAGEGGGFMKARTNVKRRGSHKF